ncbi:Agpat5 [Ecytonucleospora hepatopenaei]|uniref:Agpat5 n=1 Tax=Ecytonucleospora hepatopenaei TaxID=646526 RepID=A0A1W0E3G0_9MICR|nr:Agpat5 [Ecytonucleospora hepatopenaei]
MRGKKFFIKSEILRLIYKLTIFVLIVLSYILCIPFLFIAILFNCFNYDIICQKIVQFLGKNIWRLKEKIFLQTVRVSDFKGNLIDTNRLNKILSKKVENDKNVLFICNHLASTDFLVVNFLLQCRSEIIRYIFKDSLKYIPIFYQLCSLGGFLKLKRNFEEDKQHINEYGKRNKGICLVLFPEGTRKNKNTLSKSVAFCKKTNIKPFKNVLMPRYKGFDVLINSGHFQSLLDVTMFYSKDGKIDQPTLLDFIFSTKIFDLKLEYDYIDCSEIQKNGCKEFIIDLFRKKDNLLDFEFQKQK